MSTTDQGPPEDTRSPDEGPQPDHEYRQEEGPEEEVGPAGGSLTPINEGVRLRDQAGERVGFVQSGSGAWNGDCPKCGDRDTGWVTLGGFGCRRCDWTGTDLQELLSYVEPRAKGAEPGPTTTRSVEEILSEAGISDLSENPEMDTVDVAMRDLRSLLEGVNPGLGSLVRGKVITVLEKVGVRTPARVVDSYLSTKAEESQPEPEPPPTEADLLRVGLPILEAKDPLGLIRSRAKEAGYAGNTSALELLVLVVASRILDTPINALLKGPSAGGKSYTVECALRFHPHEAVHLLTASSERALIYSDEDFQHRHIVIAEASGIQPDGVAATIIRELSWGGRGIRYETVEKVDGQMRSRLIEKPGPTGLITTSTGNLDKEMATRLLTIMIDDSPEQTKKILDSLGAEAEDGGGSLWEQLDFSGWHAAFRWMYHYGARDVQVPYARTLARMVTRGDVRLRRDFRQVLSVVRVSALVSQRHRQLTDDGRVVANVQDYRVAYRLLRRALAISMDQVSTVIRETVENVATAVDGHPEDYGISVAALAKFMETPKQTTHYRVTQALRAEFIANLETRRGHAAKLRPAEPLPEDRAVIPDPEKLRFAIEEGIPLQDPPENDSDIGTPPQKAVPILDEQPSQCLSQKGIRPVGTPERSDTYSDPHLARSEAEKQHSVPMSERNPGVGSEGISPPPEMDLWTAGPVEDDEQEYRQYVDDERAGRPMEETDLALASAIRDEMTEDQKTDLSPPKQKRDPLADL